MKYYELNYLISPDLSEEELKACQKKITSLIQEEGGILSEVNSVVRKALAYPIKKKQAAFLATLRFQLEPERLQPTHHPLENIERKLKAEPKILRYLILTKSPTKVMMGGEKVPEVAIRPKEVIKPKPKVELKEIEKKLEEILKE